MASRLRETIVIALACAACHVGDPLVDEVDGGDGFIRIMCNKPPGCEPMERGEARQLAAVPVHVECEQTCIWQTSSGSTETCPPSVLDRLPSSAHCMNVELQPLTDTTALRVDAVEWQDVNVPLRAQQPLSVVLRTGTLTRVYFELEGPIALRIEALQQFTDLRIVGRANAHGAPRVELGAEQGNELSAGSTELLFPGEIRLRAGSYENIDVHAEAFTAESLTIHGTRLDVNMSTLTDVTLERAWIDSKHALWSAFTANDARLRFCGDARLITGQMSRCAISHCVGSSVRMFNDSFLSGSLDGDFELSDTNVENTQIAAHAPTSIFAYGSSLSSVNLCDNTQQLVFGRGAQIKCSDCADALVQNLPVCAVEEPTEKWLQNYCTGWSDEDPLPLCPADTPVRANRAR